ncbi:MAG: DUF4835 family protein [Bacteroidales bacterium]|nr:DUF4835 family protein [Bacteroidales bacterium]
MMKKWFSIIMVMSMCSSILAQEFRCAVSVNYQKLQTTTQAYETTDIKVFQTMKEAMETFMNNRKWTNLTFEQNEKLDCSISLVLNKRTSATEYEGQLSIMLRRPVYNSNYTTGLFNYIESNDFQFTFNENNIIEFDPNTFFDNLSSTMAYYAYIMLGLYFDSYALNGGQSFFEMAQTICQTAATSSGARTYRGWKQENGQKARYWFQENHINSAYDALHSAYYKYHRLGLDMMTKDQKTARANIIDALRDIQTVHKARTNLLSTTQFIDVKMAEIVSIFTPAPQEEKEEVFRIIREVTPINVSKLKDWGINMK